MGPKRLLPLFPLLKPFRAFPFPRRACFPFFLLDFACAVNSAPTPCTACPGSLADSCSLFRSVLSLAQEDFPHPRLPICISSSPGGLSLLIFLSVAPLEVKNIHERLQWDSGGRADIRPGMWHLTQRAIFIWILYGAQHVKIILCNGWQVPSGQGFLSHSFLSSPSTTGGRHSSWHLIGAQ